MQKKNKLNLKAKKVVQSRDRSPEPNFMGNSMLIQEYKHPIENKLFKRVDSLLTTLGNTESKRQHTESSLAPYHESKYTNESDIFRGPDRSTPTSEPPPALNEDLTFLNSDP